MSYQSMAAIDRLIKWAIPIGAAVSLVSASIYNGTPSSSIAVDGGERAVIFDRLKGIKQNVVGEGMHVLIPWLQKAIIFDVRTKPRNITSTTGSKGRRRFIDFFKTCRLFR